MKNSFTKLTLTSIAAMAVSHAALGQGILWSDNFDYYGAASTVTTSGNNINGYDIKFASANTSPTTENFKAIFGFDYSTVTYPIAIPSAPNSGGSTKGLYLTVNKNPAFPNGAANTLANGGTNAAVNLYPVGQSFSGDFKVKYDVWINWTNLSFSTEHAMVGINATGTRTNRIFGPGSDGIFTAMNGDGGSAGTSTTLRDFSMFQGQGAGAPLLYRTNNQAFTSLLGTQFDSANPGFASLFPSKPIYGGTPAGSAGLGWVSGEIWQTNNMITWLLNGAIIAQFANTNAYTAGNIMLGYDDAFNSLGDLNDFVIFDNIRVTTVPEPTAGMLGGLALCAMALAYRRKK